MERKLNPNLHIICGKCGCNNELSFKLNLRGNDNGDSVYPSVFVSCRNCGTLTGLDEEVEDKTDWKGLKLMLFY